MTTAAPPDGTPGGTPEPEPGTGGDTGDSYTAIAYEQLGVAPAASPRRKRRWVLVSVASSVLTLIAGAAFAYVQIGPDVSKENDSQKEYDATQPPFTVSVQPERSEPQNWAVVLDRELTSQETQEMRSKKDSSSTFSYLQGLGGRPLAYTSFLENAPKRYQEQQTSTGQEFSDTFKISFLSARAYPVVIDGWEVVDVKCERSTAKTVVYYPSEGTVSYEGILLHLPPRAGSAILQTG